MQYHRNHVKIYMPKTLLWILTNVILKLCTSQLYELHTVRIANLISIIDLQKRCKSRVCLNFTYNLFTHTMWMMLLHPFLLVYIKDLISDDGLSVDFITNSMVYSLYYTVIQISAILL